MTSRIAAEFTGSSKPDMCQILGQFCAKPATILFGRSYRFISRQEVQPVPTATWKKVLTVAMSILLLPLVALVTALGIFLTSCSVTHKADWNLMKRYENRDAIFAENLRRFEETAEQQKAAAAASSAALEAAENTDEAATAEAKSSPHKRSVGGVPTGPAYLQAIRTALGEHPGLEEIYRQSLLGDRAAARARRREEGGKGRAASVEDLAHTRSGSNGSLQGAAGTMVVRSGGPLSLDGLLPRIAHERGGSHISSAPAAPASV